MRKDNDCSGHVHAPTHRNCYEELIDKFEPTLPLLNGLATAKIQLKDYDEAHSRLQEALEYGIIDQVISSREAVDRAGPIR
mgnify:CR=1 FL=1